MKRIYIVLSLVTLLVIQAKSQPYQGQVIFESSQLREINDSLQMSFSVRVGRQAVPKCGQLVIVPQLQSGSTTEQYAPIIIAGQNRAKMNRRAVAVIGKKEKIQYQKPLYSVDVVKDQDTVLQYSVRVPYQLWMDSARLVIRQELLGCASDSFLYTYSVNNRIELQQVVPYQVQPLVSMTEPLPEQKNRKRQDQAFLDFQVGRSVILPAYRRNPQELQKIDDVFSQICNDTDVTVVGLFVDGYASPDGRYANNEKLSLERAQALKNHILKSYQLNLSGNQVRVTGTAEDWAGFKVLIQTSDIPTKDAVLAIIDNQSAPDAKEAELRRLQGGAVMRSLMRDYFPELRRVEYQIDFTVKDFTVEQTKAILNTNLDKLSQRELYLAAQSYGDQSSEYDRIILEVIPSLYPQDPTAIINASVLMIKRGEWATAKRYLDKYKDLPQSWNTMGVVLLNSGDLDAATELFTKAIGSGSREAEHNLKQVQLKREDNKKMERYTNSLKK